MVAITQATFSTKLGGDKSCGDHVLTILESYKVQLFLRCTQYNSCCKLLNSLKFVIQFESSWGPCHITVIKERLNKKFMKCYCHIFGEWSLITNNLLQALDTMKSICCSQHRWLSTLTLRYLVVETCSIDLSSTTNLTL